MNICNGPQALQSSEPIFATISSGVSIPYVTVGSRDPLLFVHGSLCDYRYWDEQIAPLSADLLRIAPSLSHYWPATEASIQGIFSLETHVTELAEFIDALGLAAVHLVGHSRGGSVAFNLGSARPHIANWPRSFSTPRCLGFDLSEHNLRSHYAAVILIERSVAKTSWCNLAE